jgi:DNA-binding MarR family transcriptional regulator
MKQKPNRNQQIEDILGKFRTINQVMTKIAQTFLKTLGITTSQMIILSLVKKNEGISIKELAENMNITSSAATQQVNNLVKKGYLLREESNVDRRLVNIHISEEMDKKIDIVETSLLKQMHVFFSEMTDEELEMVRRITNRIFDHIQQSQF